MKYITPLILSITFALTAFSADKKVPKVAAKGWCFIAPDGGKKWHAETVQIYSTARFHL